MQDVALRTMPAERALSRRALPNFVNFMRFLHPGQACAAKFASSTAELGWDGSLLHCKSQGSVMPSFPVRLGKTGRFSGCFHAGLSPETAPSAIQNKISGAVSVWTPQRRQRSPEGEGKMRSDRADDYQTRQDFAGYIGCPFLQPNALANSSKFCTVPFTRQRSAEWVSLRASWRANSSVWLVHQTWPKPRK